MPPGSTPLCLLCLLVASTGFVQGGGMVRSALGSQCGVVTTAGQLGFMEGRGMGGESRWGGQGTSSGAVNRAGEGGGCRGWGSVNGMGGGRIGLMSGMHGLRGGAGASETVAKSRNPLQGMVIRSHSDIEREKKTLQPNVKPPEERAERMIDPGLVDQEASLDDYDIDWTENGVLGSGTYSTVRVATHKKSGRRIAIKSIDLVAAEPETIVRLQREIQVLRALKNPNIIELYEIIVECGKLYMVMELCTGGELWHFLQDVKIMSNGEKYFKSKTRGMVALTEEKIASIVRGIVEAVAFCHERKVCHRDMKLENLMLEHTGEDAGVKLIDFGFSKIFNSTDGMFAVLGSPYYVAHEVLVLNQNKTKTTGYGPAADMWSVGVITYMLLCGQAPFDGKNDFERLEAVRRGTFSFPEHVKLSAHAVGFVAGLLFLDPEKRLTAPGALAHPWLSTVVRSGAKIVQKRRNPIASFLFGR